MANITADRLNNLQSRIELILGNGVGTNGYGQGTSYGESLSSFPVSKLENSNTNIVTAESINAIYTDMVRARLHQIGGNNTLEIAEIIANLNIIAENESFFVDDTGIVTSDPDGAKKGIVDFENLMEDIELDKFEMHPNNGTLENGISSSRTGNWNGLIFHELRVNFFDANHRRHFFNSGGEIRLSANNSGANTPKGGDWATFLSNIGTIRFNHEKTVSSGGTGGKDLGFYDLIDEYREIFTRNGGGYNGNTVYNGNNVRVLARLNGDSSIEFRVEFNDLVVDGNIDNNVDGRIESIVQHFRADSDYVTVSAPTYTNLTTLSSAEFDDNIIIAPPPEPEPEPEPEPQPTPEPTYAVTGNKTSIIEGESITFTVDTSLVPNGTTLYYTISGLSAVDWTDAQLSGSFTINNGSGSFTKTAASDPDIGTNSFTVNIRTGSVSGPIVAQAFASINDAPPVQPSYDMSPASTSINEGSTLTVNVATLNVPDDITLYWTISHISSSVFDFEKNNGSVVVNNNSASFTVKVLADVITEGPESFTIQLRTNSITGPVVDSTPVITINDTSVTPATVWRINGVDQPDGPIDIGTVYRDLGVTIQDVSGIDDEIMVVEIDVLPAGWLQKINGSTNNSVEFTVPGVGGSVATTLDFTPTSTGSNLMVRWKVYVKGNPDDFKYVTYTVTALEPEAPFFTNASWDMSTYTVNVDSVAVLSWTATNATSVSYVVLGPNSYSTSDDGLSAQDSVNFSFTDLGTYTAILTATGNGGSYTQQIDIEVVALEPVIDSLDWSTTTYFIGQTAGVTLDWTTTSADTVTYQVEGPDGIVASGSGALNGSSVNITFPDEEGLYTGSVTATGLGGSVTASVSINVLYPTPVIDTLTWTKTPFTISLDNSTRLSWATTNATSVDYFIQGYGGAADQPADGQSPSIQFETGDEGIVKGTITAKTPSNSVTKTANLEVLAKPTYTVTDYITSAPEGKSFTFYTRTTNLPSGTTLYFTVSGQAGAADFITPTSGSFVINNNFGSVKLDTLIDNVVEGNESFTFELRTGSISGPIVATDTSTIRDEVTLTTEITNLQFTQTEYEIGDTFEISYATLNATSVSLELVRGTTVIFTTNSNSPSGTLTLNNATSTGTVTAIMTATGPTGETIESTNTTVIEKLPVIDTLVWDRNIVTLNSNEDPASITWATSNATNVDYLITGPNNYSQTTENVSLDGSQGGFGFVDGQEGTWTVTLFATNTRGAVSDTANITVVKPAPTYSISPSTASIEDDTTEFARYTVTTTNVPDGTLLGYDIFEGSTVLSTSSVTINNNTGSFTIFGTLPTLTPGTYSVGLRLPGSSIYLASASLTVEAIPVVPTYSLSQVTSTQNEGDTVRYSVTTSDVQNGTVLYWTIGTGAGTATEDDFAFAQGTVTINNNSGEFSVDITEDQLTEGTESFSVFLKTGGYSGTVRDSKTLTVFDTSTTPAAQPSYALSANKISVNEGDNITFTLTYSNITTTTVNAYLGGGIVAADRAIDTTLVGFRDLITGPGTYSSSRTVTLKNDFLTEGNEQGKLYIPGTTPEVKVDFTVVDTSTTPVPTIDTFAFSKTSYIEGETITGSYSTSNAGRVDLIYRKDGVLVTQSNDISVNGSFFSQTAEADADYEITIVVYDNDLQNSITQTISTTPQAQPTPTYNISAGTIELSEGETFNVPVTTTNVPNGTTLYWAINGTTSDFNGIAGSFTINNNQGSFTIGTKADLITEGTEVYTLSLIDLANNGVTLDTTSIRVLDTSAAVTVPPTISFVPAAGEDYFVNNDFILSWDANGGTGVQVTLQRPSGEVTFTSTKSSDSITASVGSATGTWTATITTSGGTRTATATIKANATYNLVITNNDGGEHYTGNSFTATLNTTNVPNGTVIYWKRSGSTTGFPQTSIQNNTTSITIPNGSSGTSYTIDAEVATSGLVVESYSWTATAKPSPTFTLTPSSLTVTQGQNADFSISSNQPVGTNTIYWTATQNSTGNVRAQSSTSFSRESGSFRITTVGLPAGNYTVAIRSGSVTGTVLDSALLTIAAPVPTYDLVITNFNSPLHPAGTSFTATLNTTNVPDGTTIYWNRSNGIVTPATTIQNNTTSRSIFNGNLGESITLSVQTPLGQQVASYSWTVSEPLGGGGDGTGPDR